MIPRPQPEYPAVFPSGRKGFYTVVALFGDYHVDNQPHYTAEWPTLDSAIREADKRYEWMRRTWLPVHEPTQGRNYNWCIFVFEASDDTGETPLYARGNPDCAEG